MAIHWTVRRRIYRSACVICGSRGDIEIDHVIPLSKGGVNEESNVQPLCRYHNGVKGNRFTTEQVREKYIKGDIA